MSVAFGNFLKLHMLCLIGFIKEVGLYHPLLLVYYYYLSLSSLDVSLLLLPY